MCSQIDKDFKPFDSHFVYLCGGEVEQLERTNEMIFNRYYILIRSPDGIMLGDERVDEVGEG